MTTTPYSRAFYDMIGGGSLQSARKIVPLVLERLPVRSVLDIGCGTGAFLKSFSDHGVAEIAGVDGDYVQRDQLLIDAACFRGHDLKQPLDLGRRFDLVVTLEVAEHLPAADADTFVDNLCRHGSVVLFSAAIPQQGGTHHVNEQWPSYWAEKFAARGYDVYDVLRPLIWQDGDIQFWDRQNCLIFADTAGVAAFPTLAGARLSGPLDLVHPEMFLPKAMAVQQASQILTTMNQMCERGGLYSFSKDAAGAITIRRS